MPRALVSLLLVLLGAATGAGELASSASPAPRPHFLRLLWSTPTKWRWLRTPEVAGGSAYLMIKHGTLSELSLVDGHVLREVSPPQEGSYESPLIDGDVLYLSCGNSNLACIDRRDLRVRWSTYTFPPEDRTYSMHPMYSLSRPVIDSSNVYVTSGDGNAYCLERLSGRVRWTYRIGGSGVPQPLLLQGVLYLVAYDSSMTAVDPRTGKRKWRISLGESLGSDPPKAADGYIYCTGRRGSVFCVDPRARRVRWQRRLGEVPRIQTSASRRLVCAAAASGIYGLDPATGRILWQRKIAGGGPVEARGRIYCYASGVDLIVLDARTGATLASYPIGEPGFFPQPVLAGDRILVAGRGMLYCLADVSP